MASEDEDRLTIAEVAEMLGVKAGTFGAYARRGQAPKPDGYVGRTPWWRRSTVEAWQASRPGPGRWGSR